MKRKILFILFSAIFLLSACSQGLLAEEKFKEKHEQYLLDKGWAIKKLKGIETFTLNYPDELLSNFEGSKITFLRDYQGSDVTEYVYTLKQKDAEGEKLQAILLEVDNEIIGGYGHLPSWIPGVFNLDDKERLLSNKMIK